MAAGYHLLGYLPPNVQHTCSLGRASDTRRTQAVARQVTAELYCYPQDGLNVTFVQLSSSAALGRLYTSYLGSNFQPQLFDSSARCESQGTWSSNGVDAGREACYRNGTTADAEVAIVWTYNRANIFGIAYRQDGNADSLRSWWDGAGPQPYSTPDTALPTPVENATANKALLARFPSQVRSRSRCTPVNLASQSALGDQDDWRMWLTGAVDCMAHGLPVAGVSYVQWTNSAALAAYLRFVDENASTPPDQATGCISGGYDVQGQPTGDYVCTSARRHDQPHEEPHRGRGLVEQSAGHRCVRGAKRQRHCDAHAVVALRREWAALLGSDAPDGHHPDERTAGQCPEGLYLPAHLLLIALDVTRGLNGWPSGASRQQPATRGVLNRESHLAVLVRVSP